MYSVQRERKGRVEEDSDSKGNQTSAGSRTLGCTGTLALTPLASPHNMKPTKQELVSWGMTLSLTIIIAKGLITHESVIQINCFR